MKNNKLGIANHKTQISRKTVKKYDWTLNFLITRPIKKKKEKNKEKQKYISKKADEGHWTL